LLAVCCVVALGFEGAPSAVSVSTDKEQREGSFVLDVEDPYGSQMRGNKGGNKGKHSKMTGNKGKAQKGMTGKAMVPKGKPKTSKSPAKVSPVTSSSACSSYTSCSSCTSSSSFTGSCRWCPTDQSCHDHGSLLNPCSSVENYFDPAMCTCKCAQGCGGVPASACAWYSTASSVLSDDTSTWTGADFLPTQYTNAATCACTGGGSPLWNAPIVPCVRQHILQGHQQMSDAMKRKAREAKLSLLGGFSSNDVIQYLYQVHVGAYQACGCPGTPAPLPTWELLYDAPQNTPIVCNEVPIVGVLWLILEYGRCGCGW